MCKKFVSLYLTCYSVPVDFVYAMYVFMYIAYRPGLSELATIFIY